MVFDFFLFLFLGRVATPRIRAVARVYRTILLDELLGLGRAKIYGYFNGSRFAITNV
jgi:hypothetical protein